MASAFFRSMLCPPALGIGLGLTLATLTHQQRPLRCESSAIPSYDSRNAYLQRSALQDRHLNSNTARQISSGSIIGLCAGLAVSTFSRSLALLIGLLVVAVQWAASHGINVLPYDKIQQYVTSINLRSALEDNMPFKMSFGTTFAMAAFMHF